MGKFAMGLLLMCWLGGIADAEYKLYKDPTKPMNRRIKDLMGRMSLEEKIGQMMQIELAVASPQVMKDYYIGLSTI